ncbi:hypothetical protein SCUP515_06170 [Seiridium cupressi]
MSLDYRMLLCLAAFLFYGVDQVTAVPHWGRFDRRLDASNQTSSSTVALSETSQASAVLSSSLSSFASEAGGISVSEAVTAQLSVVSISAGSVASSPSSQQIHTLNGLETITTVARPTTFTFGFSTTTTARASSVLPDSSSGVISDYSPPPSSQPSSQTSISTFPASYVNTSSIASSSSISAVNGTNIVSPTVAVPPPVITTYEPPNPISPADEVTSDACDVTTNSNIVTVWSTIYTTTITWTLPPEQYTPPFPTTASTVPTPVICSQTTARLSASKCEGSGCTVFTYPAATSSDDGNRHVNPTATAGTTLAASSGQAGGQGAGLSTITFYTTDKNPAVVYSTEQPPDYGDSGTTLVQNHNTPNGGNFPATTPPYQKATTSSSTNAGGSNGGGSSGDKTAGAGGSANGGGNSGGNSAGAGNNSGGNTADAGGNGVGGGGGGAAAQPTPEPARQNPTPTTAVTVIIQTTQVIINDHTFTDSPQSKTSTVVVGTDTFVINPSEVIGAGATVRRPVAGGIFIPTATTTTVAGVEVVYTAIGSSAASGHSVFGVATIDGTTFTLGVASSNVVVKGQTIMLGPVGIAFASQTIPVVTAAAAATESAVLGGEMLTAVGNSLAVIDGTTFTYRPGMSTLTEIVDGDTILIGPSGVSVHGMTLGGITAAPTATTYEIVGGATITEIGGSAVVVDGTTYSIGSGAASAVTTVIDGQTLTIGPSGVAMSSYTFAQPYVTSTVIEPGSTSSVAAATATHTTENAGLTLRPAWNTGIMGMCIAIGVGLMGGLLL